MSDLTISRRAAPRRAALLGAGAIAAWAASPARALLQAADRGEAPASVDALIAKMTLEEKAGQLTLNAAACAGRRSGQLGT